MLLAFTAALVGVALGRALVPGEATSRTELHELLHDNLDLDPLQRAKLEALERGFAIQRHALELQLRTDNARLANAIEVEHGNGPKVGAAVDASHQAMGELQKATLAHIFAMRRILRPDQTPSFDRAVVKALTLDAQ